MKIASLKRNGSSLLRGGALALGILLHLNLTQTRAAESEDSTEYRNWFTTGVGITLFDGDEAAFKRRQQMPTGVFGGIEDFHYEQDVGKKGLLKLDGRGIFDNHDYSLKLELSNPEIGYLRAGYREFRTWYDGSGGFFPVNGKWFPPEAEELAIDRGEAFFEAGLTLPNKPEIHIRYSHQFRDGQKESLVWGESELTGITVGSKGRAFIPSFWNIDEERDILAADVKHTFGSTGVGLGVRYEIQDNENSRNIRRRRDEPQDRYLTQKEGVDSDLFNAHAFTETRFNDSVLLTTGYSFTTLDSDLSGSRIYGAGYDAMYDPVFSRRQFRDEGFYDLHGGSQLKQYVMNLNLMLTPWPAVTIVPSVRIEKQDLQSIAEYMETNVGAAPTLRSTADEIQSSSERGLLDISEAVEIRYTGFTNWVLYASGLWIQGDGDLSELMIETHSGAVDLARNTDFERFVHKYTAGVNWYPLRRLNFAIQYYHKIRDDDYMHEFDSTSNNFTSGNRYPAFLAGHDFDTDDVNFRVTVRPFNNLTLVSRYDFQLSTIDVTGFGLLNQQSAEITTHILSETITWSPLPRLYLQASANYVMDLTDTPSDDRSATAPDSDNDYWNTSFLAGYALTDTTDIQAQYFYYRADNYENTAAATMPYGIGAEEHGIIGTLTQKITSRLRWTLKYGFFAYHDQTSGGFNDYQGHLAYSTLQYRF
jgi:hypothetical protein